MHRVDPARLDLAREFKSNPTGPHSPELQKLLKLLRWEPIVLLCYVLTSRISFTTKDSKVVIESDRPDSDPD